MISPSSETIVDKAPTYTWNVDPVCTWYKLWVGYPNDEKIFTQWYEASDICSGGTCSVTPEIELQGGDYEWCIKSWNDYGNVWSDGMSFTVQKNNDLPSKVDHTSPSGTTYETTPTFTWNADPASTWYRLWVGYPNDNRLFAQWYDSADICSAGNCSVDLDSELADGDYEWYIKSWNDYGKIWSDGMSFTILE